MIYIFIDLSVNFFAMNIGDALDYICFTCIRCNGTTLIAEIHRRIMLDRELYLSRRIEHNSLYEFLYSIAVDIQGTSAVGSCSENRFTFSGGSNCTSWNVHQNDLLEVIKNCFPSDLYHSPSKKKYDRAVRALMTELLSVDVVTKKKKYIGIGDMGSIQFVQMSSLLGLIPLYCFQYNSIRSTKLGPAKFIARSYSKNNTDISLEEYNRIFQTIQREFQEIWGSKITSSLLENTLCELWRSYKRTVRAMKKEVSEIGVDVITNQSLFVDSSVKDVYYYDDRRQCIQNIFNIQTSGKGLTYLHPALVMKSYNVTGMRGNNSHVTITNWKQDKHDHKNMFWSDMGDDRTVATSLQLDKTFKNSFVLNDDF